MSWINIPTYKQHDDDPRGGGSGSVIESSLKRLHTYLVAQFACMWDGWDINTTSTAPFVQYIHM